MAARTALLQMARRTAAAPVHVTRRNMSGGLTIQQERGATSPTSASLNP